VQGPGPVEATLPEPPKVAGYLRDVCVLAFPAAQRFPLAGLEGKAAFTIGAGGPDTRTPPEGALIARHNVLDITGRMDPSGKLRWSAPPGRWTILRVAHTPTGVENAPSPASGRGLECDKLATEGIDAHFRGMMAKLIADVGPDAGKTLVATHIDSWENGSQNWTPRFRDEFRRLRGYDPQPYLPVIAGFVVESMEVSERFLWDVRQTVSDLVVANYAGRLRELARRHGMKLTIEAYGSPTADLPYAGRCDEPMAEFWIGGGALETAKEMSSAAHIYGKPVVGAEAFTAADQERWLEHPGSIKALGDRAFCDGINRFVFHRYALQPWRDRRPGMTMGPWGIHYERTQTWWERTPAWHRYLARCQHLLRQGVFVADIAYLLPEGSPQGGANHARHGYDHDLMSAEAVETLMRVENGLLALPSGMRYRALVLPNSGTMTPRLLRRIAALVRAGATVIGNRPAKSPSLSGYPARDEEVRRLAEELWADCDGNRVKVRRVGRGRIVCGLTPEQVFARDRVPPDFSASHNLRWIHRRAGGADVYFVANPFGQAMNAVCSFRVTGKTPEIWRPDTGEREAAAAFEETGGVTRVRMRLEPSDSVFVVFRRPSAGVDAAVDLAKDGRSLWARVPAPRIEVVRAIWSAPMRRLDVRAYLQDLVDSGTRTFTVSDLIAMGDPAPLVVKELKLEYEIGGERRTLTARDPDTVRLGEPEEESKPIRIVSAHWGPPGEVERSKDVTDQVRRIVASGTSSFLVATLASEGDPAVNILKTLRVEYRVKGELRTASAVDSEVISFGLPSDAPPPATLRRTHQGLRLEASAPGLYTVRMRSGRTLRFRAGAPPSPVAAAGPWEVRFAPGWGAPERVQLPALISWHRHSNEGVRYFSGKAVYRTTLRAPAALCAAGQRVTLDLGDVRVMARPRLNGRDLGTLWRAPYRVDVSGLLKPGANTLEVEVINLWPNRMIGDEKLPEDSQRHPNGTLRDWPDWVNGTGASPTGRLTFTTWRLWRRSDPLQPSGLIGPVRLTAARIVEPR